MAAPIDPLKAKVHQWVHLANEDLQVAEHISSAGLPTRLAAFHAQQCAEKYLKAFLVSCAVDFPYTHNVSTLLELAARQAPSLASLDDVEVLTAYAISVRYPGDEDPVTEGEASEAVELARKTRTAIMRLLRGNGFEF